MVTASQLADSPEVRAARAAAVAARARPRLELFRDGRVIAGYVCRFTAGRLAMLQAAGIRGFVEDSGEPRQQDVIDALWFLVESHRDAAVWIAGDAQHMEKRLRSWRRSFSGRAGERVALEVLAWMQEITDAMPDRDPEAGGSNDPNWCMALVDLLASEYGWSREYILWALPFPVAVRLQERIAVRRGVKEQSGDISDDAIMMLEAARAARKRMEAERNGKG